MRYGSAKFFENVIFTITAYLPIMKYLLQIFVFLSFTQVMAQDITLKLASNVWPPFTNISEKNAVASDLVAEALHRSGIKVNNEIVEFDEILSSIKTGAVDGIPALWENHNRDGFMLFSEPYLYNQLVLVSKKGAPVNLSSFSELKGKKVAVVGAYAYGDKLNQTEGLELVLGKNDQENLSKLLKEEVDYMLVDALLIHFLLRHQPEEVEEHLEVGSQTMLVKPLHFALHKDYPNAAEIIADFNKQITTMKSDGTYNRILHLNWIRIDVNGDGKMELVLHGVHAGETAPISSYNLMSHDADATKDSIGYYIDGKHYTSWDHVPAHYKVDMELIRHDFDVMSFNF